MRFVKGNIAGLTSPRQQSEMKSILGGTWPPLMPLPVFKYETDEYRATIDFDKKRGEWVCRKTSLPSNKRSEEHTSELQSRLHLVCRLLLEKKKNTNIALRDSERICTYSPLLTI